MHPKGFPVTAVCEEVTSSNAWRWKTFAKTHHDLNYDHGKGRVCYSPLKLNRLTDGSIAFTNILCDWELYQVEPVYVVYIWRNMTADEDIRKGIGKVTSGFDDTLRRRRDMDKLFEKKDIHPYPHSPSVSSESDHSLSLSLSHEGYGKDWIVEMYVSVVGGRDTPFTTHIGITRTIESMYLGSKASNISPLLHAFAAKVMRRQFPQKQYMITKPITRMLELFKTMVDPQDVFLGDRWLVYADVQVLHSKEARDSPGFDHFTNPHRLILFLDKESGKEEENKDGSRRSSREETCRRIRLYREEPMKTNLLFASVLCPQRKDPGAYLWYALKNIIGQCWAAIDYRALAQPRAQFPILSSSAVQEEKDRQTEE